jgi:hypothetical protein
MWCSDQPVHCSNKDLRRERHITESATLRTKCARAHLVRESRTFGSVRGEGSDALAYSENRPTADARERQDSGCQPRHRQLCYRTPVGDYRPGSSGKSSDAMPMPITLLSSVI